MSLLMPARVAMLGVALVSKTLIRTRMCEASASSKPKAFALADCPSQGQSLGEKNEASGHDARAGEE